MFPSSSSVTSASREGAPFLMLSRYEELCDFTRPLVLLGEHIRCDANRERLESGPAAPVVLEPWNDLGALTAAARYVDGLAESWLPGVAGALNRIHRSNHSVRYWRILLGHWLRFYLGALYDRYVRLEQALATYPGASTILVGQGSEITPLDLTHFHNLLKEDLYNHQLYSQLLRGMDRDHSSKDVAASLGDSRAKLVRLSIGERIKSAISMAGRRPVLPPRVVLRSTLAPAWFQRRLMVVTMGRHWPILNRSWSGRPGKINEEARSGFAASVPVETEFERLAAGLLSKGMPQSLIENYAEAATLCARRYPRRVATIVSANAWHTDELFIHWAATQAELGARLVVMQHGGNYGSSAELPFERHERLICDRYLTWGWNDSEPNPLIRPGPAWKLLPNQKRAIRPADGGILYVATHACRHPFLLSPFEVRFPEYLDWQARFYKAMPDSLRPELRVRLHAEDLGWNMAQRWREWNPQIHLEGWSVSFGASLRNSRMYVCDHLSTTFLEALASNIPTVLFWDPILNPLRASAASYYQELRDAGILCESPEQAAATVAMAYADVARWWLDPVRQKVRMHFCARFARESADPLSEWKHLVEEGWKR